MVRYPKESQQADRNQCRSADLITRRSLYESCSRRAARLRAVAKVLGSCVPVTVKARPAISDDPEDGCKDRPTMTAVGADPTPMEPSGARAPTPGTGAAAEIVAPLRRVRLRRGMSWCDSYSEMETVVRAPTPRRTRSHVALDNCFHTSTLRYVPYRTRAANGASLTLAFVEFPYFRESRLKCTCSERCGFCPPQAPYSWVW